VAETGPGAAEERIADLLRQWQESPAPRVGLQLAEEYRRGGRHADARAVLERSLENHPGHLSSLVALGKAQLDLGEAAAAAARFQQVLERDPTHLVAGKLLIEAHLRRGDAVGARERLDLYRLLNAGDPELEDLARRTGELEGAGEPAGSPPAAGVEKAAAAAPTEPAVPEPTAPPAAAAERGAPPAAASGPAAPPAAAVAGAEPEPAVAAAGPSLSPFEPGAGDPFGPLAGAGDERRWLTGLAAAGIFALELPPEPEPVPAGGHPAAPSEAEPAAMVEEEARPAALAEPAAEVEEVEAEEWPAAAVEAEPAAAVETEWPAPAAAAAEEEAVVAAEPGGPTAAGTPPAEPGERATGTLGELYLAQGHLDEAERVFHAVLARRPGDAAAGAGLAEVARRRRAPISAAELMRWAAGRGQPVAAGDRRTRSATLLRAYLARLHGGSHTDVP